MSSKPMTKRKMRSNIKKSLLLVRNLRLQDIGQIARFEELFGYDLSSAEDDEDNDFSYGLFHNDQLLGVATVGYADVLGDIYSSDYLLSDVGILPEYQGQGLGTYFMKNLLKRFENEIVHAIILEDELFKFYKQFGFANDSKSESIVKNGGNKNDKF